MSSHKSFWVSGVGRCLVATTMGILTVATAHATLPEWLQHVVGASSIEAALFRSMPLPSVQALYPRPPKEAQGELARLISAAPDDAQLYALRAQSDEAALDFASAEADWKLAVAHSKDPVNGKLQLADYYDRRLEIPQEIAALDEVAAAPAIPSERFDAASQQRSWKAYGRILALIDDQGLPPAQTSATFQAFLTRYPAEPAVYAQFLSWQLAQKSWPDAETLIARYKKAFPQDAIFPIRAQALLDYRRGDIDRALAVYDQSFQPLWPAQLVQSYFGLLAATHRERAFVADARARLAAHPGGPEALNALARIFYYFQQQGNLAQAQQTLDSFRIARESRNGQWTAQDLSTLAALSTSIHSYAEAARYHYALASTPGNLPSGEPAAQAGLSGLIDLLLTAPDQPIALGAGNLSLYRDVAALDQGPGYWNGILSLWLNGGSPEQEYNSETAKAQSYFHRAKAAELLSELDRKFPAAPSRAALHAQLIHTYAEYSEPDAVIADGKTFLASFSASPDRVEIAGLMADAYARQQNTAAEFALYDSLLTELAAKTSGQPLSAGGSPVAPLAAAVNPEPDADTPATPSKASAAMSAASYELASYTPDSPVIPEAVEYSRILDRYIGRLVAEKKIPQALTVLRRQLDLNPNDPLLYERLASFLQQNNLSQQQEETYQLAIAHFQDAGWYDKLARLYLRERNREAYTALAHQVTDIFSGTDLDSWFAQVGNLGVFNQPNQPIGSQLALQLNLYAQKRFPHDLVFTRNLLRAYDTRPTLNRTAYEDLLRHHWWEADDLRGEFFTYLARNGKLQTELAALGSPSPSDPAATREAAEIQIWTSHFEAATPLMGTVAEEYPADPTTGDQAVSLFRSLAYLDPSSASTTHAVAVEKNLIAADPADANRLATLGDLYAEATATGGEEIAAATPYWRRIPQLHPGTPAGYLTSATIFWDYFQFNDALAEIVAARTRFHQPAIYGYEAGAIAENRHDLPTAIAEYTAVATNPPGNTIFLDSVHAAVGAYLRPPSDAADSNLWSTAQSLFNSAEARSRLLQLATRPATRKLVDDATAKAVAASNIPVTLTLRADVLIAQKRQAELAPLLEQALARATTEDEAAAIGDLARSHSESLAEPALLNQVTVQLDSGQVSNGYAKTGYALTAVYEHALERQISLSTDPIQKIQLSYTLSGSLEARKDIPGAARVIDSVYRANPRILGVVRATTDFYARTGQPPRAIATLLEAAKVATLDLARNFTLEAAQKANEAGDTAQARALAQQLLPQDPYDATVLGIIAASYARANDDAGLKDFYLAQMAAIKAAQLTPGERRDHTAMLRRGLIPALTRLKDYAGAVDQYIALMSAYPGDESTAQEAALYALHYNRQAQLVGFLTTTVKQSPRDSRFLILLAEVDTTFEDLPGAVAAYGQAIAIRKDRADLYTARVDLEQRLGQDEAAAADFQRLYVLGYKDPAWMVKLAELRARQQRPADALKALETAYIAGLAPSAHNCFTVADQLAKWNFLPEARTYAEKGIALAGSSLLTQANSGEAADYARILTRLGKPQDALATLNKSFQTLDASPAISAADAAQYAEAGSSPADIAKARDQAAAVRRQTARQELSLAVTAIGQAVQTYYTPEQKAAYALTLDQLRQSNRDLALQAVASAGFAEVEAEWRKHSLLNDALPPDDGEYIQLENRRLKYTELGNTLELYATRVGTVRRNMVLAQAATAYRNAGDESDELRLTRPLVLAGEDALRDRLFDLLLRHDIPGLIALAGSKDPTLADAAANYAVAHANKAQALAAVAARGQRMPPVWTPATASLVLTNFAAPPTPADLANFTRSLASDQTVAQRLAARADTAHQLTGPKWFYYAGRFGLFLNTAPKSPTLPDADDFLPSELELNPGSPVVYLHLARNYADAANYSASAEQYRHALELAPNNPAVHDEFAVALYRGGRKDEATAEWKAAFAILAKRQSGEEFFNAFKSLVAHLSQRGLFVSFRPEVDAVLKPYLARNGNYRSNELLEAIYKASATPAEGTALILAAANFAADPNLPLEDLRRYDWIAPESRETILLRQIELERNKPKGDTDSSPQGLRGYQMELIEFYLDRNQIAKAEQMMNSVAVDPAYSTSADRIVIATRSGHLQGLLDTWRDRPATMPQAFEFDAAVYRLAKPTLDYKPDMAAIRPLQEFIFAQKQLTHALFPTDFLALAQARIDTNDLPGALELLHRLSLQPVAAPRYSYGQTTIDPYANVDSAAALLESTKHYAEAVPFLTALAKSVPGTPPTGSV